MRHARNHLSEAGQLFRLDKLALCIFQLLMRSPLGGNHLFELFVGRFERNIGGAQFILSAGQLMIALNGGRICGEQQVQNLRAIGRDKMLLAVNEYLDSLPIVVVRANLIVTQHKIEFERSDTVLRMA